MSDTKFTPGPWRWGENEYGYEALIAADGEPVINSAPYEGMWFSCRGWDAENKRWTGEEENKQLIAAAPEMYAALKVVRNLVDTDELRDRIDAILTKARGES